MRNEVQHKHHGTQGSQTVNQSRRYGNCTVISLHRYRYSLTYDLLIQIRPSPLAPCAARWRSAFGGMFGEIPTHTRCVRVDILGGTVPLMANNRDCVP